MHDNRYLHALHDVKFNYDRWNMISAYRKFMFVRSPFERVVSAYRDKLEYLTGEEQFDFPPYFRHLLEERFG